MATLVKESMGLASVAEVIPLSAWWEAWLHTAGPEAVAENHILICWKRDVGLGVGFCDLDTYPSDTLTPMRPYLLIRLK